MPSPISYLRIIMRLRPILAKFGNLTKMKLSVNVAIQMLALAAQGANQVQEFLPPRGKFWVAVLLTAIQGITAVLAHFANPPQFDGGKK